MKVVRNTPDQLIVADRPWLLAIALSLFILVFVAVGLFMVSEGEWFGLVFALVGGGLGFGAFAAFVRRMQVIFDRASDSILIRRRSLFGFSEVRHTLSDLDRAELEHTTSSKGGRLYRPVLVLDTGMSAGRHPLVEAYTNTAGPGRIVKAINGWLGPGRTAPAGDSMVDSAARTS